MTLKPCPCCKKPQTTKTAKKVARLEGLIYFNCLSCKSTFVIGRGPQFEKVA